MRVSKKSIAVIAVAAIGVAVAPAGHAAGKPKPKPLPTVCNLLTDPAGDASIQPPIPSDDNLDILSADIATSAKTITAVLRLKGYSGTDLTAPAGRNYYVLFTAPGQANPIFMSYQLSATGTGSYAFGTLVPGTPPTYTKAKATAQATGSISGSDITINVPLSAMSELANLKPGMKLTDLHAESTAAFVVVVFTVDSATGGKTYVVGQPSCVKPTP